jgi:hypothetical protein
LDHALANGLAAVGDFAEMENSLLCWICVEANQCDTGGFSARIKFNGDRLKMAGGFQC